MSIRSSIWNAYPTEVLLTFFFQKDFIPVTECINMIPVIAFCMTTESVCEIWSGIMAGKTELRNISVGLSKGLGTVKALAMHLINFLSTHPHHILIIFVLGILPAIHVTAT